MKTKIIILVVELFLIISPSIVFAYGGGSGTYSYAPIVDDNSLIINNGDASTSSTLVILSISANDADQMAISNYSNFENASWENYATSRNWILTLGEGQKTVYIKFRSSTGAVSAVISKSILLVKQQLWNQADLNHDGNVDDLDFSILIANWGSPYFTETDINNDGVVNDFDFSIMMHEWTR